MGSGENLKGAAVQLLEVTGSDGVAMLIGARIRGTASLGHTVHRDAERNAARQYTGHQEDPQQGLFCAGQGGVGHMALRQARFSA